MICTECEERLDDEQAANPMHDDGGDIICDDCHREEFQDECKRCENIVDKTEVEARPGELIAVLRKTNGLSKTMEPGYYRILEWPFFADGMIEGHFYDRNLERVADLDQQAIDAIEYTAYDAISLCVACRQDVGGGI